MINKIKKNNNSISNFKNSKRNTENDCYDDITIYDDNSIDYRICVATDDAY